MTPDLFQDLVVSTQRPARPRRWLLPVSLAVHATAVALLFTVPILLSDDIPTPSAAMRAFFVEPATTLAPPPPPPPVSRSAQRVVSSPSADDRALQLTAPIEIPDEFVENAALDLGVEGGVPGGVVGGVVGGVLGGLVGGLADVAAPRVLRAGGQISEPRKLREVAPVYPTLARRRGIQGNVVLDCIVDHRGRVAEARVIGSPPVLLEGAALEAVRQWIYTPTLLNGAPVSVRLTVTIRFSLRAVA